MLSTNLQLTQTDVWTLSNYQSVLLNMMAACAYMNSETLFFADYMYINGKYDGIIFVFLTGPDTLTIEKIMSEKPVAIVHHVPHNFLLKYVLLIHTTI
jgi:hypothetical protein